jgi:uroporphyrinogen decarboxylase
VNSIERITATLQGEKADRVPVIAQVFGHAATIGGVHLGDYVRDGSLLARCQIEALKRYEYDAVFALMDTSVETEAAGSVLNYSPDNYPTVKSYILERPDIFPDLIFPDPLSSGRMPEILKAARILRKEVGDQTLVVGCVLGPLTITTQLMGMQNALYYAIDEPDHFTKILDYATALAKVFGKAQIEAGVHLPVVFDPSASPAVVPPGFFREFELPRLRSLFADFKKQGSVANWLHIAGPATPILPSYREAGVDIANFDYPVSPEAAQGALPITCLDGNIKPLSFVEADPGEITREANRLQAAFASRRKFILSSGCEIPPESRPENIEAMVQAAKNPLYARV